jgi:hypothetical protein
LPKHTNTYICKKLNFEIKEKIIMEWSIYLAVIIRKRSRSTINDLQTLIYNYISSTDVAVKYPKFDGDGYMAFPVLKDSYKQFEVHLEFRPDDINGLVLFSGEMKNAESDFFSLALVDGFVEFRYLHYTFRRQHTYKTLVIHKELPPYSPSGH